MARRRTHRSLSIYDNAMLILAINDYLELLGPGAPEAAQWTKTRDELKHNIAQISLGQEESEVLPRTCISPARRFPRISTRTQSTTHGGTAVAIEAGLLTRKEIAHSLKRMDADVRDAHAATIGLTMYPAYPLGYFHKQANDHALHLPKRRRLDVVRRAHGAGSD